jgi:predicted Abi (CAAX) family protease
VAGRGRLARPRGVHFDPIFLLVSGLLALAAVLSSYITQYMWFVLATLGLLIVVLLVVHLRATQRMKTASDAGETPESLPPPQKLTSGD